MFVDRIENLNDEIAGFKEIKGDEYVLNLNSLSLSLVDDIRQIEILYLSITSSSINWGEKLNKKLKVFKAFPNYRNEKIEEAYQKYLASASMPASTSSTSISQSDNQTKLDKHKAILIDDEDEVDFDRMVLYVGKKEIPIERQYAPSLYVNFFSSVAQKTLHLMIHKLQVYFYIYKAFLKFE